MRKAILTIVLFGVAVATYAGTALGAGTAGSEGQVRFMNSDRCDLVFGFDGFAPGTQGRLEVRIDGSVSTINFLVPESRARRFRLPPEFMFPGAPMVQVEYRIAVQGMSNVVSGVTMANCDCGEEEGGGSGSGGTGEGGGSGTGAGPATPISSQPGFAG
jgi:hypothetical protein